MLLGLHSSLKILHELNRVSVKFCLAIQAVEHFITFGLEQCTYRQRTALLSDQEYSFTRLLATRTFTEKCIFNFQHLLIF